jgi:hypothetical protein
MVSIVSMVSMDSMDSMVSMDMETRLGNRQRTPQQKFSWERT